MKENWRNHKIIQILKTFFQKEKKQQLNNSVCVFKKDMWIKWLANYRSRKKKNVQRIKFGGGSGVRGSPSRGGGTKILAIK